MKYLIKTLLAFLIIANAYSPAVAQSKKANKNAEKAAQIKKMIESQNFIFEATYAYPSFGTQRYLNTYYDLKVSKDTISSYLPFMGVAYSADYNSDNTGIKFTSTDFTYTSQTKKNGSYYIVIKPKNIISANQMALSISANGSADLSVQSNNRERMRFTDDIKQKNN